MMARVRSAAPVIESGLRAGYSIRTILERLNHDELAITYPSATQQSESAVGREVGQLGTEITRKNLNVESTVRSQQATSSTFASIGTFCLSNRTTRQVLCNPNECQSVRDEFLKGNKL